MQVHLIVYSSTSLIPPAYADREIGDIVTRSIDQNGRNAVTGALIYSEGRRFAQALEGHVTAVAAIMEKITRDTRHNRIVTLHDGPSQGRYFSNWSLAFRGNATAVDYAILDAEQAAGLPSGKALGGLISAMQYFAAQRL